MESILDCRVQATLLRVTPDEDTVKVTPLKLEAFKDRAQHILCAVRAVRRD